MNSPAFGGQATPETTSLFPARSGFGNGNGTGIDGGSPAETRTAKPFTTDDFRTELLKIMPGYKWTVHRAAKDAVRLVATGIQSSGFNRLSTLQVERVLERERPWYKVKSAGFGTRAPWHTEIGDGTLARALRSLQQHYERTCNSYGALASDLQKGRAQHDR